MYRSPTYGQQRRGRIAVTLAGAIAAAVLLGGSRAGPAIHAALAHPWGTAAPVSVPATAALTEPTTGAARQLAAETHQRVQVTNLTSKQRLVYANPDGTFTAQISNGPARERDATVPGGWASIDTRLHRTGTAVRPERTDTRMAFSAGGTGSVASLHAGRVSLVESAGRALAMPHLHGNTATYAAVRPGVDLQLAALTQGFEQSWVIRSRRAGALRLRMPLTLHGLRPVQGTDGGFKLVDSSGIVRGLISPALIWDARHDPATGGPANAATARTSIARAGHSRYVLTVTPSREYLRTAVYPVTVDPSATLSNATDTYIDNSHTTSWFQNSTQLKSGLDGLDQGQLQRSLLSFPTSSLTGQTIQSATLNLFESYSGSNTPTPVDIYNVTSPWDGTITWANQPTVGAIYASASTDAGYGSAYPDAAVSFSGGGEGGTSLANLVQGWANGSIPNNGIEIQADDETSTAQYKRFNSAESGSNPPTLSVTYAAPSAPTAPQQVDPGGGVLVPTATPALSADYDDPDVSGHASYSVYLRNADGSNGAAVVTNLAGSTVSDGDLSTATVPAGQLTSGTAYNLVAVNIGGGQTSPGTSTWFQVDTADPTADSNDPSQQVTSPTVAPADDTDSAAIADSRSIDPVQDLVATGDTQAQAQAEAAATSTNNLALTHETCGQRYTYTAKSGGSTYTYGQAHRCVDIYKVINDGSSKYNWRVIFIRTYFWGMNDNSVFHFQVGQVRNQAIAGPASGLQIDDSWPTSAASVCNASATVTFGINYSPVSASVTWPYVKCYNSLFGQFFPNANGTWTAQAFWRGGAHQQSDTRNLFSWAMERYPQGTSPPPWQYNLHPSVWPSQCQSC